MDKQLFHLKVIEHMNGRHMMVKYLETLPNRKALIRHLIQAVTAMIKQARL